MRFINNLKTSVLLGGMIGLCMLIGHLAGGSNGLIFGLIFGGFGAVISFWFSDKIAIAAMGGRLVTRREAPELVDMVDRLANRAGLPTPRVYICPQPAPNAFATGRNPKNSAVAITQGMLQSFPMSEIEGVMAHELAHIKHRDVLISTIAAVLGAMISYGAYMLMWMGAGRREGQHPLMAVGALLAVIIAPLAAGIVQMAISRQREYAADSYGGELCGDPLKLASALQRLGSLNKQIPTETPPALHGLYIVQPLSAQSMASLFSTHPPLDKRIALLRKQAGR